MGANIDARKNIVYIYTVIVYMARFLLYVDI